MGRGTSVCKVFRREGGELRGSPSGAIDVNVEEIAGSTTANMDAKLKVQVSSGELPDVFYTNDQSIIDLAKKSNLLYDFKEKLDADAELKDELDMEDIASWNEGSDQVYGICSHKDFFGFFYNKEILKAAGYEKFPESWDELYKLCEKLKEDGIAAMSLETKTAWYSSLTLLAALASGSEEGQEMAKTVGLTDYNTRNSFGADVTAPKNVYGIFNNRCSGLGY